MDALGLQILGMESSTNNLRNEVDELESEELLRHDVMYKSIIRDMRKFLTKDFNLKTDFINLKRNKDPDFFIHCLQQYLSMLNKSLGNLSIIEPLDPYLNFQLDSQDLVFFLGSFLYPKFLEKAFDFASKKFKMSDLQTTIKKRNVDYRYLIFHTFLYSFSLEKLYVLVNLDLFALFYCFYFKKVIVEGRKI